MRSKILGYDAQHFGKQLIKISALPPSPPPQDGGCKFLRNAVYQATSRHITEDHRAYSHAVESFLQQILVLQLNRKLPIFTETDTFFRVQKKTSLYLNIRQHPTPVPRISFLGAFRIFAKISYCLRYFRPFSACQNVSTRPTLDEFL
jgi:hypothetical protein